MICGKAECGLLYAVKRSGSSVGYCSLSIRCGTRNENGYNNGIAHFTEHTIFKGTLRKSSSVINSYLDKLGGELNAYTTKEEIVLHATVLKEDLNKAGNLLFELATESTFPEKEIEIERGVVLEEIRSYKDSPADDVYDRFEQLLFAGHPLANLILGSEESVKNISSDELRRFVKEKFVPWSMAFSIVADIDEKEMERRVLKLADAFFPEKFTGQMIAGNCSGTFLNEKKPIKNNFNLIEYKNNYEVNAVIGSFAPSLYETQPRLATVLFSNILAGPASNSILNSILRERNGWVYSVESSYTKYADTGVLAICLGCDKANIEKCKASIHKEIEKLQTIPLSVSRLNAAKKQLLGQLAISSDNGEAQCLGMGKSLLSYGKVDSDDLVKSQILSVSSEDIRRAACSIFNPEYLSTLVYM